MTFGEQAITNVTLVITDQNDMLPTFNRYVSKMSKKCLKYIVLVYIRKFLFIYFCRENFTVVVPEDVGQDTPLPDLNMIVSDGDISRNAEYDLVLEDIENSEGVFAVYPTRGTRNTPVTIRVADPSRYINDELTQNYFFGIKKSIFSFIF